MIWNGVNRLLKFGSGEFLLNRRPNGGDVVFVRSLMSSLLLFLLAIAVKARFVSGGSSAFCASCLRDEIGSNLAWFGAIFAALYIGLYTRFSSQWTYLAGLYNQMMASQLQVPFARDPDTVRTYVTWWAAFIEDAEDVHLALKKNYAAVIAGLLADQRIRDTYAKATVGGAKRLEALEQKLASALGDADFKALKDSGAVLADTRQPASFSHRSQSLTPPIASRPTQVPAKSHSPENVATIPPAKGFYPGRPEVNAQYQHIIDLLISLSTASLVLPPLFLREILGVKDEPLALFLDAKVFWSWGFLAFAILLGICFQYASAKWLKQAWGQPVSIPPKRLERIMDVLFWGTTASFIAGIGFFLTFIRIG